jgi:hypothetical protein
MTININMEVNMEREKILCPLKRNIHQIQDMDTITEFGSCEHEDCGWYCRLTNRCGIATIGLINV